MLKSFVILFLLTLSMLLIIPNSFGELSKYEIIFEDKIYTINDTITITGTTYSPDYTVIYDIENPDNKAVMTYGFVSDSDSNFSHEIDLSTLGVFGPYTYYPERIINGTYTIIILGFGGPNHIPSTYTFEFLHFIIPSIQITLQTDKLEYYIDDSIIIVNGTINNVDLSEDTTVNYDIYYEQEIIESGNTTLQNDETFSFVINTDNELWDYFYGNVDVFVYIQNTTKSFSFPYYNTPNMSNEVLYEMDMEQYNILEQHDILIEDQQTKIADIQTDIVDVKTDIDDVKTDMNETKSDIVDVQTTVIQQQSVIDVIVSFLEDWGFILSEQETIGDDSILLTELNDSSLPEGMDSEPQCGIGMELVDGYCFLIK